MAGFFSITHQSGLSGNVFVILVYIFKFGFCHTFCKDIKSDKSTYKKKQLRKKIFL